MDFIAKAMVNKNRERMGIKPDMLDAVHVAEAGPRRREIPRPVRACRDEPGRGGEDWSAGQFESGEDTPDGSHPGEATPT